MGYYTYYTLSYFGSKEDEQAVSDFEPNEDDFHVTSDGLKTLIADNGDCSWKWYHWEEDMKKLCKIFPNILFILNGDGEESDDLWQWRGKGDQYEYHCVEMPPFTNPELKLQNEN